MKKDDLRASFGKIRPREELINETLVKMKKEKERKEQRYVFTPAFSKGMRLAGALCAFALVFCIGFVVARQSATPVIEGRRGAIELDTGNVANVPGVASYNLEGETDGNYLIVNGKINSLTFSGVGEEDVDNGVLYRVFADLTISNIEFKSENFPLETVMSELEAEILFYDAESLHYYYDIVSEEMTYRLTYDEEKGWEISDILIAIN